MSATPPAYDVNTFSLAERRLDPPVDAAGTHHAHCARVRRLAELKTDGIPGDVAAATYDAYVSALTYVAAYLSYPLYERIVEDPDAVLSDDEVELLQAAERILQAYSISGNARAKDPNDKLRIINPDRPSARPASEGAFRDAARRLIRSPPYQDGRFFDAVRRLNQAPEAIALCLITGVRNKELAHGVRVQPVEDEPDKFLVYITGAKVSPAHNRGLPYRMLMFEKRCDPTKPLGFVTACLERAGAHTVRCSEGTLLSAVKAAAHASFRRPLAQSVTPYVLRHVVAGRLRRRARKREAMAMLGHLGPQSVYAYFNGDDAGDLPVHVHAAELEPGAAPEMPAPGT
jgi:integrase